MTGVQTCVFRSRRRPEPIPGSEYFLPVDTVIMSIGTTPNPLIKMTTDGLDTQKWGGIIINEENGQTSRQEVFAGGDAVTGAATVILAMGVPIDGVVWHLDVGSSHPGAEAGPKGSAVRRLKWYASWV